jgi:hypothetical protein
VFGAAINTLVVEFFVALAMLFTFLVLFFRNLEKDKKHIRLDM